ncbi:hypothetical protein PHLCEN_2v9157 [Hermanssonia centrifuga]|uniref:Uncharacterized protein n=1 Tax=Hermanssonia centrifuga TaxID=98765 RepID=A0A2R6NRM0_9APHY|nr:hypothetical protein PHLCEN_2v9157 [Hermanssonia centrifuga]
MANSHKDLCEYTSGNWVLSKLAEGGFNRTFLITLRDDFQLVARIPYPITVPKFYAVASEVATLEFLRSSGLPVPKIYGYSLNSDNAAGTLGEVISVVRQLTQLESVMMSLSFPAGGSLYFTKDLEKFATGLDIPLEDERFCIGPDTRLPLWYGRRSKLDFNQPLLPFRRERRTGYQYQEQSPSAHVENLNRYLLIASSFVPRDPTLSRFCIRHPDLQQSNILVSRSPDSDCQVVGLLDWQHASILPAFLLAGVPQRLQNYDDPVSQSMTPPSLLEDFDELDGTGRTRAEEVYRDRLVHHLYVTGTEECNKLHYAAFTDPMYALRDRLFQYAGSTWEGETFELKLALIQATERWKALTGGGVPCPVEFDAEDVRETRKLNEVQARADRFFEMWQNMVGLGEEGWVPTEDYEDAVAFFKKSKEEGLADCKSAEERAEIMGHWPWDDMDEEKYM